MQAVTGPLLLSLFQVYGTVFSTSKQFMFVYEVEGNFVQLLFFINEKTNTEGVAITQTKSSQQEAQKPKNVILNKSTQHFQA